MNSFMLELDYLLCRLIRIENKAGFAPRLYNAHLLLRKLNRVDRVHPNSHECFDDRWPQLIQRIPSQTSDWSVLGLRFHDASKQVSNTFVNIPYVSRGQYSSNIVANTAVHCTTFIVNAFS